MIYNSFEKPAFLNVLNFLKAHSKEYLSGQDLSDVLKISRVAVWKHISKIKKLGYEIESKQKLGYRLKKNTPVPLPWEIKNGLETKNIGKLIYFFDTIDSTQDYAIGLPENKKNGTVVIALNQTHGRGRLNRRWLSPKGGLWLSIVINPDIDISKISLIPLVTGVAIAKTIKQAIQTEPKLKWPNDVTIQGKKVAGVVVDTSIESNRINKVVLGIGINHNVKSKALEKKIKKTKNFYGATSISEYNPSKNAIDFTQTLLQEIEKSFDSFERNGAKNILSEWTRMASTLGKTVSVQTTDETIKGKAVKIDADGALVIAHNSANKRVLVGDVIHSS